MTEHPQRMTGTAISFEVSAGQLQDTPKARIDGQTAGAIGMEVAKAIAHFRPDLRGGQADLLTEDFIQDLGRYRIQEIQDAFASYRRDAANRFFPRPGQIIALIAEDRKERREMDRLDSKAARGIPDPRPLMWWYLPKKLWATHWREDDIPADQQENYRTWLEAKRAA